MRTTLTLDADVARLIKDAAHQQRRPIKQVVNDALRRALAPKPAQTERYEVRTHHSAIRAGVDLAGFNRLADEFENEAIIDGQRRAA